MISSNGIFRPVLIVSQSSVLRTMVPRVGGSMGENVAHKCQWSKGDGGELGLPASESDFYVIATRASSSRATLDESS